MNSTPTRAHLQATVASQAETIAQLQEHVAALQELVEEIRLTAVVPWAAAGHNDERNELGWDRLITIGCRTPWQELQFDADEIRRSAQRFRENRAPAEYRVVCHAPLEYYDRERCTGTCQLDPGHDGPHSSDSEAAAVAPQATPDGTPAADVQDVEPEVCNMSMGDAYYYFGCTLPAGHSGGHCGGSARCCAPTCAETGQAPPDLGGPRPAGFDIPFGFGEVKILSAP